MTAIAENGNRIVFCRNWFKHQGWVATAPLIRNLTRVRVGTITLLPSEPYSAKDAAINQSRKTCYHVTFIPEDYTGLIVSQSVINHSNSSAEKHYWWADQGQIVAGASKLKDLLEKIAHTHQ